MNKLNTFILIIVTFIIILLSIIPLMFVTTYVLTGMSKDSFITILQQIPARIFWMIGLPLFFMCYAFTAYLIWKFVKLGASHPESLKLKVKKVYHLEDIDLNKNLSGLISNNKDADTNSIPEILDNDINKFGGDMKVLGNEIWRLPDYIITFSDYIRNFPDNIRKVYNYIKSVINKFSIMFVDYLTMKAIDVRIKTNNVRIKSNNNKNIKGS